MRARRLPQSQRQESRNGVPDKVIASIEEVSVAQRFETG